MAGGGAGLLGLVSLTAWPGSSMQRQGSADSWGQVCGPDGLLRPAPEGTGPARELGYRFQVLRPSPVENPGQPGRDPTTYS
ncbi:hypothetical protein O9K51_09175 [Purpureocillium lavendulum]|uniref:Uncharacterized protein n=1 Tax=Purpureocillium lavendulum TaxID=1247861 RepID=A0AB34FHU3_9HYPO|nr:hypothetical protein O9K51_09175 [Purpureocillium lavendulum]